MSRDPRQELERMQACICSWEEQRDARSVFLSCYAAMTRNMVLALDAGEFHDAIWVSHLLVHFADYYFTALEAYDAGDEAVPAVWRRAHDAAGRTTTPVLLNLLLGVNAHINYDLCLATADLLEDEWSSLTGEARRRRQEDYDRVNQIISRTIDEVQDEIMERREPLLDVIDTLLGPVDEWLISHQVSSWRSRIWLEAVRRVEAPDAEERERHRQSVEAAALQWAQRLGG